MTPQPPSSQELQKAIEESKFALRYKGVASDRVDTTSHVFDQLLSAARSLQQIQQATGTDSEHLQFSLQLLTRAEKAEKALQQVEIDFQMCGSAKQSAENDRDYLLGLLKENNIEVDIQAMPSNYGQAYITQLQQVEKERDELNKEIQKAQEYFRQGADDRWQAGTSAIDSLIKQLATVTQERDEANKKLGRLSKLMDVCQQQDKGVSDNEIAASASFKEAVSYTTLEMLEEEHVQLTGDFGKAMDKLNELGDVPIVRTAGGYWPKLRELDAFKEALSTPSAREYLRGQAARQ